MSRHRTASPAPKGFRPIGRETLKPRNHPRPMTFFVSPSPKATPESSYQQGCLNVSHRLSYDRPVIVRFREARDPDAVFERDNPFKPFQVCLLALNAALSPKSKPKPPRKPLIGSQRTSGVTETPVPDETALAYFFATTPKTTQTLAISSPCTLTPIFVRRADAEGNSWSVTPAYLLFRRPISCGLRIGRACSNPASPPRSGPTAG